MKVKTPVNAVYYARVSSKEQKEEGFSLENQSRRIEEYCLDEKIKLKQQYVIFESASSYKKRKKFWEMIEFVKENKIELVICTKVDRITRNFKEMLVIDKLVEEYDVKIFFLDDNLLLDRRMRVSDKIQWRMKVLFAEMYIEQMRENVTQGMNEKVKEHGEWAHTAPQGYLNVEERKRHFIALDERKYPIIQKAFELFAEGNHSCRTLAKELKKLGLTKRKSNNALTPGQVHHILTNPFYYGMMRWKGELYKGSHEPIISKELFDKVQEVLANGSKKKSTYATLPFVFRGLITCGECGCLVTAEKKKGKYIYWHCTRYNKNCSQKKYVRQEKLEKQIKGFIDSIHIPENIVDWLTNKLRASHEEKVEFHKNIIRNLMRNHTRYQGYMERPFIFGCVEMRNLL